MNSMYISSEIEKKLVQYTFKIIPNTMVINITALAVTTCTKKSQSFNHSVAQKRPMAA